MKSFLQETAEDIINRFGKNLKGIELIFPNKRTDFHFKKCLGQAIGKTSWSPKTFTIQKYVANLTNLQSLDRISLLFELYHAFKETDNQFNYDFDSFYKLGEIILHDFNEIDNYLVDATQIFTNIKDLHEIDHKYGNLTEEQLKIIRQYWQNFSIEQKSREKEQFLKLWNILTLVYQQFSARLLSKNLGYEGLIYRQLIKITANNQLPESDSVKVFIGFNALNKAQKVFFKYLKNKQKAFFYWDNDSYYHHNKIQEAGDFLRKNYEILDENPDTVPGNFKAFEKSVKLIGIPGKIGQAKAIPQILKDLCHNNEKLTNPEKTVVVLPDENMLFPVLNSIPHFIEKLNITMGFPLKNTSLYSLLIFFIKIQQVINQKDVKNIKIYNKDVLAILNHPYINTRFPGIVAKISEEIIKKQMVYVNPKILLSEGNKLFEELFSCVVSEKAEDSTAKFLNVLFLLFNSAPGRLNGQKSVEDEYIYHTYTQIKRLHDVFQKEAENIGLSFNIALQFIKQVLGKVSIPFESESTDGLQIMGLIETRNIDFENVILLNANEGILPKLNRPPSLISESMRYAFDLPVLKYQDSIFAYFFYRLLQRAKNIYILYDNLGSTSRSGELSRFIYQLELESGFEITRLQLIQNVKLINNQQIRIKKSGSIIEKLNQYIIKDGTSGKLLSASSIDTYINCSLQFYFRYIAEIKEPEKVEEEFSPLEMGIIIHSTMEYLFKEIIQKKNSNVIDKQDFKYLHGIVDENLEKSFINHLNIEDAKNFEYSGNLLIIKEVIKKFIIYILEYDSQRAPFEIIQLESSEANRSSIEIERYGQIAKVAIRGIIDRIDKKGTDLYIIDYKTGKVDKDFSSLDQLFTNESENRKKAILQIMLYSLLVKENDAFIQFKTVPYIYDIRNMYQKSFEPSVIFKIDREKYELKGQLFDDVLKDYGSRLKAMVEEIFNPEIDFSQTVHEKNCRYCSYRAICGKEG